MSLFDEVCVAAGLRRKVVTTFVHPPIPVRSFDWVAHLEGDEEGLTGRGETEADALRDLAEKAEA